MTAKTLWHQKHVAAYTNFVYLNSEVGVFKRVEDMFVGKKEHIFFSGESLARKIAYTHDNYTLTLKGYSKFPHSSKLLNYRNFDFADWASYAATLDTHNRFYTNLNDLYIQ